MTPIPPEEREVKSLTLTKEDGTTFKYWPVFNKNNPPEGIAWYKGTQEIQNVKSMKALADNNVDSYAVTTSGAEFTAVRGYNEPWSYAFNVNPDTGKTTGVYNGAGKLDDNDFCVPLVEPTFKNLRDMSYYYMADYENPRISILANNPERKLRDDLCVKFSDIQDAYGSSICDDTTCNNYWTTYVVESYPGYRTYWSLNQYIDTNKFTGWVNDVVDSVNGATLFERQFN